MENLCFHFFRTTSWRCRIVSRSVILLVLQSGIQHIFSLGLAGFQLAINRLVMSPVLSATLFALYLVDELDAFFFQNEFFFWILGSCTSHQNSVNSYAQESAWSLNAFKARSSWGHFVEVKKLASSISRSTATQVSQRHKPSWYCLCLWGWPGNVHSGHVYIYM